MHRRWLLKKTNPEYISYLSRAASISPALAQVLINRGVKTPEDVHSFMSQGLDAMCDPFDISGMGTLVDAVLGARHRGLKVFIHGDYDADGLTATAIMAGALMRLGIDVRYYIPNRFTDGYGFHPPAVEQAKAFGAGLIITVDCGITSFEAAEAARASGIDLIITDHHEPAPISGDVAGRALLPEAMAIINPKLSAEGSAAAGLSGAGIAFKAVQALSMKEPSLFEPREFIDLATLGTIADSVPLVGENRTIVREGLPALVDARRPGARALKEVAELGSRALKARLVAFTLVPRINAAGRLGDAAEVVELLLTDSASRAEEIAASLNRKNYERQKTEVAVFEEAIELVEKKGYGSAIVLAGEGWHEGVVGIVASRIAETYQRPTFVLSIKDDGSAKGSARGIPGFDVHAALTAASEHLMGFGGHKQAAGLRLRATELEAFQRKMEEVAASLMEDFTPTLDIDAGVVLKDVTFGLVREFEALEPFGYGNPEPVLGSRGLEAMNPRVVGNNHLKVKLRGENCAHDAIGWGMGGLCDFVSEAGKVDAAFAATINDWNGNRIVQLSLKGLREANAPVSR